MAKNQINPKESAVRKHILKFKDLNPQIDLISRINFYNPSF